MSFNDGALKKWSLLFSADTLLDKASFLIASLVPISFVQMHKGTNYVVVDLEDLKTHTAMALRGCKYLVEAGFATWLQFTENPENSTEIDDNSIGILAIGKMKGFRSNSFIFFMEEVLPKEKSEEVVKNMHNDNYSSALGMIDEHFGRYEKYCDKNGYPNVPIKLYRDIKIIFNKSKAGKLTRSEFLQYLYLMNSMVYDMIKIPTQKEMDGKMAELKVANQIVTSVTPEDAIQLVPFFVLNYHKFARKGSEETSIYNLKFNLTTVLKRMRESVAETTKFDDNENDSL